MASIPQHWTIVEGNQGPDCIAFSLVHPLQRLDITASDLLGVEAHAEQTFVFDDGTSKTYALPYVEVCLSPDIRAKLYRLTHAILRHDFPVKTLELVVGDESLTKPVIREPIGSQPSFHISTNSLAEAESLACRLRGNWSRPDLRVVT
jgi:hypothetical protein